MLSHLQLVAYLGFSLGLSESLISTVSDHLTPHWHHRRILDDLSDRAERQSKALGVPLVEYSFHELVQIGETKILRERFCDALVLSLRSNINDLDVAVLGRVSARCCKLPGENVMRYEEDLSDDGITTCCSKSTFESFFGHLFQVARWLNAIASASFGFPWGHSIHIEEYYIKLQILADIQLGGESCIVEFKVRLKEDIWRFTQHTAPSSQDETMMHIFSSSGEWLQAIQWFCEHFKIEGPFELGEGFVGTFPNAYLANGSAFQVRKQLPKRGQNTQT